LVASLFGRGQRHQPARRACNGGDVKKEEAVESIERAGLTISDLYSRAWSTALYPTQHGWATSLACVVAIPALSMASLGQMVGAAVVNQIPPDVFDSVSNFGKPKE
jgi:hypothetical protein